MAGVHKPRVNREVRIRFQLRRRHVRRTGSEVVALTVGDGVVGNIGGARGSDHEPDLIHSDDIAGYVASRVPQKGDSAAILDDGIVQ